MTSASRIEQGFSVLAVVAALALFLNFLMLPRDFLEAVASWFPFIVILTLVAGLIYAALHIAFRQARETDRLKYEFITIA